jgi:hypothetical protein
VHDERSITGRLGRYRNSKVDGGMSHLLLKFGGGSSDDYAT